MKKYLALILALMLLLTACAPAGQAQDEHPQTTAAGSQEPESAGNSGEPTKLKICVMKHPADRIDDFNKKPMIKEAIEKLNLEIEWDVISADGNGPEQVATRLAGDLPDIFLGVLQPNQILDNAELFVPLEDKLEKSAPHVYKLYTEEIQDWERFLTFPDGHIYGLMTKSVDPGRGLIQGTMWINKTWLDNLGLEVPTNLEELEKVLVAFRDEDANGNGDPNDEIPLNWCQAFFNAKYTELANSFGLPLGSVNNTKTDTAYFDIVDGKVVPVLNSDRFREFVEYFHRLTAEGLANPEGTTQKTDQYFSQLSSNISGCFYEWSNVQHISDTAVSGQYTCVGPLAAPGCTYRRFATPIGAERGFVITQNCENVDAALAFWDYLSKDVATARSTRHGPEGLMWVDVDGEQHPRDCTKEEAIEYGLEELADLAGTPAFQASVGMINTAPVTVKTPANYIGDTDTRQNAVDLYKNALVEQTIPNIVVPKDLKEEFAFATDGLQDYINGFVCNSIINGVTDESWEDFQKGLSSHGYEFYIEYYQRVVGGNFE